MVNVVKRPDFLTNINAPVKLRSCACESVTSNAQETSNSTIQICKLYCTVTQKISRINVCKS